MIFPSKALIDASAAAAPALPLAPPTRPRRPAALGWGAALLGHAFFVVATYSVLYCFGLVRAVPTADNVITWDAGWYNSIRLNGYVGNPGGQSNIAFFPLFPYLWRLSGLDGLQVGIANFGVLLLGGGLLGRGLGLSRSQVLLVLSGPLMFFCCVPYAEALFFLFGVLLLWGLHRQRLWLTVVGLVGCCLVRSSATLFVPAFLMAELLGCTHRAAVPAALRRFGAGLLAIGGSLGFVMWLHHAATGNWLAFFETHKSWGHEPHWTLGYPLHSVAGVAVLWLDALGLVLGLLAVVAGLGLGLRWAWGWARPASAAARPVSRAVLFSLGFCIAALCFILLYQTDNIVGMARYTLTAPFTWFLFSQLPQLGRWPARGRWAALAAVALALLGVAFWLGFPWHFEGFFVGPAAWYLLLWLLYAVALGLAWWPTFEGGRELRAGLYVANVVLQCFLFSVFLSLMPIN